MVSTSPLVAELHTRLRAAHAVHRIRRVLRRHRHVGDADGASTIPTAEIAALVAHQIAPLGDATIDRRRLPEALQAFNARSPTTSVYEIRGRQVSVWEKSQPRRRWLWQGAPVAGLALRRTIYLALLSAAAGRRTAPSDLLIAMDHDDHVIGLPGCPVFGFQRPEGSADTLLLPDIDLLVSRWSPDFRDRNRYEDKKIKACFAGSSTGGIVTEEVIREASLPRLRAARHFLASPDVDFRIAQAVQHDSEAARALLMRQPYFGAWLSWQAQLRHRFLLSMDGNGAACSRLALALKSNSVVVKYRSPHMLYYFPALVAGRDYVEVGEDREVEDLIALEKASPGHCRAIAQAGSAFAARHLTPASGLAYTVALLDAYADIYYR